LENFPQKIDRLVPEHENLISAKKYLELSKNFLTENSKPPGYTFVEEINSYLQSILDHVCLIREEGLSAQLVLQKLETPAGSEITMIPFFEIPQEKRNSVPFLDESMELHK
jgi:hypothetical protein